MENDKLGEFLEASARQLEELLRLMRRRQSALLEASQAPKQKLCAADFVEGSPGDFHLSQIIELLTEQFRLLERSFWQELTKTAEDRGIPFEQPAYLQDLAGEITEEEVQGMSAVRALPACVDSNGAGISCFAVDGRLGCFALKVNYLTGEVFPYVAEQVASNKPWPLQAEVVVENVEKLSNSLEAGATAPPIFLARLATAATVLGRPRQAAYDLMDLWKIGHAIGLMAGNFGRHPNRANLACYSKLQFCYDALKAAKSLDNEKNSNGVHIVGNSVIFDERNA